MEWSWYQQTLEDHSPSEPTWFSPSMLSSWISHWTYTQSSTWKPSFLSLLRPYLAVKQLFKTTATYKQSLQLPFRAIICAIFDAIVLQSCFDTMLKFHASQVWSIFWQLQTTKNVNVLKCLSLKKQLAQPKIYQKLDHTQHNFNGKNQFLIFPSIRIIRLPYQGKFPFTTPWKIPIQETKPCPKSLG